MAKSDNEAREQRILDAAADLFVHYGYDKTTVSDIAREAGVSKGAIYLHFESKDALFEALLSREMAAYSAIWLDRLDADPQGGTIAGLYKNSLYALDGNAFVAALFKQDTHIFGSYLRKPGTLFRAFRDGPSPRYTFVTMMQEAGAIRPDLDPKVVAHIMDMLAYGLVAMKEVKPAEDIPPTEAVIEGIADLMDRALTPAGGGNSEAGKAIIRHVAETTRLQLARMKNPEPEATP